MFICVEYRTTADDPRLFGSPHTVERYYEVRRKPEAWQIARHYNASHANCDPSTIIIKELGKETVERLRAEGTVFHKIEF